jgi:bacteriocin biosynthesis cyclodehydratase domain-containing protein
VSNATLQTRGRPRAGVVIVGQSALADLIAADLAAAGPGTVAVARGAADHDGAADQDGPTAPDPLVVFVDAGAEADWNLAAAHAALGLRVLRVAAVPGSAEIGPLFAGRMTACMNCFNAARRDAGWLPPGMDDVPEWQAWLAAGLAVDETLALTGGGVIPRSFRTILRVALDELSWDRFTLAPAPDCPLCGPPGGGPADPARPAWGPAAELARRYEWVVEDHAGAEDRVWGVPELTLARRQYPTCPQQALPFPLPPPHRQAGGEDRESSSLARIGEILNRVAGLKPGTAEPAEYPLRWTPGAGNLASVEIHAVTPETGLLGFPGNVAKYDDLGHRLIAVRWSPVSVRDLLRNTGLGHENLEALLVITAALGRVEQEYDVFSYRLVHLDAGCALTQLVTVATARGYAVRVAPTWDTDAVTAALDLRPPAEIITALAGLYRGSS